MTTYQITTTRTKFADVPAPIAAHVRIETRVRKPESRAYTVDIPTTAWIDTSSCPVQFKPLVDSALLDAAEKVLSGFVTSTATRGNQHIPAKLLELDNLLNATASCRMTVAQLIGMWRNSSKYILDVAPKLAQYAGTQLLRYQVNIERHEKRLGLLVGKNAETTLSATDLDKIMLNLADDDSDTPFGAYLADRTEEVRGKLAEDSDAL